MQNISAVGVKTRPSTSWHSNFLKNFSFTVHIIRCVSLYHLPYIRLSSA